MEVKEEHENQSLKHETKNQFHCFVMTCRNETSHNVRLLETNLLFLQASAHVL
jgi:hypothetical protein